MDWIIELIEKHTSESGIINREALQKDLEVEAPKRVVPKAVFNEKLEEVKASRDLVDSLKKDNQDASELKAKVADYEKLISDLKEQHIKEKLDNTLRDNLRAAGATDIDYMIYQLGDIEKDDLGNPKDLESRIKDLKEKHKSHFITEEVKDETDNAGVKGFKVFDNKLDTGKEQDKAQQAKADIEEVLGLK